MKIVALSKNGIRPGKPELVTGNAQKFWAFNHGEEGRGRWQIKLPLAVREYPADVEPAGDEEYKLVPLNRQDARENDLFILARGEQDGKQLVLWSLSPGFRGGATWDVHGEASVVAIGEEAQGDAGGMGKAACPVILVTGPCKLAWQRSGRTYGDPKKWVAEYDGKTWSVGPESERLLEAAALEY